MSQAIKKQSIVFENNGEAVAVLPSASANAEEIVMALDIKGHKAVLLIIGGADNLDPKKKSRLIQLFGRGIARAAINANAVIIDGGTASGVMEMMGQGVKDRGSKSPLIGVAPLGMITDHAGTGSGDTPVDPNHSHFVLVEGNAWGSETGAIYKLVSALTGKTTPGLVILAGGGAISKSEALQAVRHNLPLVVVKGSGALADEIAVAWEARPKVPDDPVIAEIIAGGRIEFHLLTNSVKGAERIIIRELGGDNGDPKATDDDPGN